MTSVDVVGQKAISKLAKIIARRYQKKIEKNKVTTQPKLQRIVYS